MVVHSPARLSHSTGLSSCRLSYMVVMPCRHRCRSQWVGPAGLQSASNCPAQGTTPLRNRDDTSSQSLTSTSVASLIYAISNSALLIFSGSSSPDSATIDPLPYLYSSYGWPTYRTLLIAGTTFSLKVICVLWVMLLRVLRANSTRAPGYFSHTRCTFSRHARLLPVPAGPAIKISSLLS